MLLNDIPRIYSVSIYEEFWISHAWIPAKMYSWEQKKAGLFQIQERLPGKRPSPPPNWPLIKQWKEQTTGSHLAKGLMSCVNFQIYHGVLCSCYLLFFLYLDSISRPKHYYFKATKLSSSNYKGKPPEPNTHFV